MYCPTSVGYWKEGMKFQRHHGNILRTAVEDANTKGNIGTLLDVSVVSDNEVTDNIISVPKLDAAGYTTIFGNKKVQLFDDKNNLIYESFLNMDMCYRVPLSIFIKKNERILIASTKPQENASLIHRRLD